MKLKNKNEKILLKDAIELVSGRDLTKDQYNSDGIGIPYIMGASNIKDGKFLIERWTDSPTVIGIEGDVILSVKGTVGLFFILEEKEVHLSRQVMALRVKDGFLNDYIKYFLAFYIEKLKEKAKGMIPGITREDILFAELPNIELEDQKAIVNILKIAESLIEKRKSQIEDLTSLVQIAFTELFGDPLKNNKGWKEASWEEVFSTKTGKLNANAMNEDGQYPFFTCSKEVFNIDTYSFDQEALILAGNNAVGNYDVKYYSGKFDAYQRTYILSLIDKSNKYKFFKTLLESKLKLLQKNSIGSNTKYLTLQILKKINFINPPESLQDEFVRIVTEIEKQKLLMKNNLIELDVNFSSLLHRAFKGNLFNN